MTCPDLRTFVNKCLQIQIRKSNLFISKSNVENGAIFPIYTDYREKCEKFPKQFPKDG